MNSGDFRGISAESHGKAVDLEPSLRRMFGPPDDASGPNAFVLRTGIAASIEGAFETVDYPLASFKRLPAAIRASCARSGVLAVRFEGDRAQYVVDPSSLAAGARP